MSQSQNKSQLRRLILNTPKSSSDDEGEASSRDRQAIAPIALGTAVFTPIPSLWPRASSLLPSSDGPTPSSPIVGTKAEQHAIRHRKSQRKRLATLESQKITKEQRAREAENGKRAFLDTILASLSECGYTINDLMLHVFDPQYWQGITRWEGFFRSPGAATHILDLWVAKSNSHSARMEVHNWTIDYISRVVKTEAHKITTSGWLQSVNKPMNAAYILAFDMAKIYARLRTEANTTMKIFAAFATGPRHTNVTEQRTWKKQTVSPI
jgi:hypothetical protein